MPCIGYCCSAVMLRLWLPDRLFQTMQCGLQLWVITMLSHQQIDRQGKLRRIFNPFQLATSQPWRHHLAAEVAGTALLQQHL